MLTLIQRLVLFTGCFVESAVMGEERQLSSWAGNSVLSSWDFHTERVLLPVLTVNTTVVTFALKDPAFLFKGQFGVDSTDFQKKKTQTLEEGMKCW